MAKSCIALFDAMDSHLYKNALERITVTAQHLKIWVSSQAAPEKNRAAGPEYAGTVGRNRMRCIELILIFS